jgi:hypothetical protein
MAEVTISPQNSSSNTVNEIPSLISSDNNQTSNSDDVDEPPSKKCKILLNDKPRLLEDRIGSILSCCICLDLSTLAMFQV